jgi:hypothetical protein
MVEAMSDASFPVDLLTTLLSVGDRASEQGVGGATCRRYARRSTAEAPAPPRIRLRTEG